MGVPRADGFAGKCNLNNKKNYRTRCSALIKFDKKNILIDTSPDLRQQLLSHKIKTVDRVFYTHMHGDQTHGINDLRPFFINNNNNRLPIYADKNTSKYLTSTFSYCFKSKGYYPAMLELKKLKKEHIITHNKKKISIKTVTVEHGSITSICYIINKKLAYASDVSLISKKDIRLFKNLRYFVVDCLWDIDHSYSHFNLNKVIDLVNLIKPQKTILTNMHSSQDYDELLKKLPRNIVPGYDGITLTL
tara:strand:+ start:4083 stop:4823 length:741 start_codon:yes stop_codon:yes gene_type:complete